MIRILVPTLIALSVSSVSLAQQTTEEVENKAENIAQSAETAVENAADNAEAATENLAQEADSMGDNLETDRPMLRRPANIDREGYMAIEPEQLTAEELTGTRVYGANDEDIGEVDELILSDDGSTVEKVVVDVGGFLGMGEREVAVTIEELHIMRSEDGSDFRVYMDATQEELEAQPEYEG